MQVPGHLTIETIKRYRLRRLLPAELLAVHTHAATCDECRTGLGAASDLESALAKACAEFVADDFDDEPEHLPYEQLVAYVDGTADEVEREISENHLAVCRECAGDVADLRRYQTIASGAEDVLLVADPPRKNVKSLKQRLFSFIPIASFGVPMAVAATIVVAVLLAVWLTGRTGNQSDPGKVAQGQPAEGVSTPAKQSTSTGIVDGASNPMPPPPTSRPNLQQSTNSATERVNSSAQSQQKSLANGSTSAASLVPQVALNDGGKWVEVDNHGNLHGLDNLSPAAQRIVRRSLAAQRAETPTALANLDRGASGILMGEPANGAGSSVPFALIEPVGKVVRDDSPVLRWRTLAGATCYKTAVVDLDFRIVAESPCLTATQWTPPVALPRGKTFYWQVTAALAGGSEVTSPSAPAPQATFRVLEENAVADLVLMEQAAPSSHLARGVLYARAGLLEEAEAEFQKLVNLNPRSPVARKLLWSVRRR